MASGGACLAGENLYPGQAWVEIEGKQARLRGRLGRLTPRDLAEVELALKITLGLAP